MDLKDIKAIIELMNENSINEFELERKEFKVRLKRLDDTQHNAPILANLTPQHLLSAPYQTAASNLPHPAPSPAAPPPEKSEETPENLTPIKSPMIGTFYRAPSPESDNYVKVGSEVEPDTVVCIIEAMKVMNEIKAEASGVISKIVVENGKPVEFDQPLFLISPA